MRPQAFRPGRLGTVSGLPVLLWNKCVAASDLSHLERAESAFISECEA